jgi:putative ABC transport system substrate-binding protein
MTILLAVGTSPALPGRGGNITGLASLFPELSGKRLELLKEIVPKLARVAVFGTSTSTDYAQTLKEIKLAAGALGVKLQYLDIRSPKDFETAFRAAGKERADAALMQVSGLLMNFQRKEIVELAVKNRLPVTYHRREYVEAGGLMSYGVNYADLDRRAATYVDKILKGAKPDDLPVEQPIKFEFNIKPAKQISLTRTPSNRYWAGLRAGRRETVRSQVAWLAGCT